MNRKWMDLHKRMDALEAHVGLNKAREVATDDDQDEEAEAPEAPAKDEGSAPLADAATIKAVNKALAPKPVDEPKAKPKKE